jgi:ATP synthase protein I
MPNPEDQHDAALRRLDERLDSLEAGRARPNGGMGSETRAASDGYRLLGELIGGILAGLGFGWVFDYYLHTTPWGLLGGLLLGLAISVFMLVKQATRMSARTTGQGPVDPASPTD